MTYRRNDEIQAGLVAYLKSKSAIYTLLYGDDKEQIKEDEWQGTEAFYPGVRVKMIDSTPVDNCDKLNYSATILVFSEDASSKEADTIAGIITTTLHGKGFHSAGVAFTCRVTRIVHAVRQDQRTWRSEVHITGIAS